MSCYKGEPIVHRCYICDSTPVKDTQLDAGLDIPITSWHTTDDGETVCNRCYEISLDALHELNLDDE